MNNEIKEILDELENYYDRDITLDEIKLIRDNMTNLQEKLEFKDLILKALHKYFTEHEEYENDEFLRQLESCTKNDMVWLKRMAGDDNGDKF